MSDVLTTIRRHAEVHRMLAISDAYSEQEAPRLERAQSAVSELVEAAKDFEHFGRIEIDPSQAGLYKSLVRVRAALESFGGAK